MSRIGSVYAGWPELSMTPEGRADPVFGELSDRLRVLKWHEDEIEVPRIATVLGDTSSPGVALFRVGPAAWGSQMHLEVTPRMLIDGWLSEDIGVSEIEDAGHEIDAFRAESMAALPAQMEESRRVFSRFAGVVRGVAPAPAGAGAGGGAGARGDRPGAGGPTSGRHRARRVVDVASVLSRMRELGAPRPGRSSAIGAPHAGRRGPRVGGGAGGTARPAPPR